MKLTTHTIESWSYEELQARLKKHEETIQKAYWEFTRQARAKPPSLVYPQAYRERQLIENELQRRWSYLYK